MSRVADWMGVSIAADGVCLPHRDGRALPIWFRVELFREWVDHALERSVGSAKHRPTVKMTALSPT